MNRKTLSRGFIAALVPLVIGVAGMLTGCASTPNPPTASLEAARQSIANAEQARAAEHAPLKLSTAREKLAAANTAIDNENMMQAARLAEESKVLADLAFAEAEMEDARRVNQEIVRSTEVLKEEMQRNTNRESRHDQF